MDIRQLETFVHVARLKSFSRAAEKLYITQPTVTNHIQNLEQELDTLLISRLGRKIKITDEGIVLYNYAIDILNLLDNAKYDLQAIQQDVKGHLTISASSVPRKKILPSIITRFSTEYPNVSFTIGEKDSNMVVQSIIEGETDFGILGAKFNDQNIDYIKIMEDELVLVVPNNSDFPKDNGSILPKDVLLKNKIITREQGSGTRKVVEDELTSTGFDVNSLDYFAFIEDTELIKELVSNGLGISIFSLKTIEEEVEKSKLKYFRLEGVSMVRDFYFAFHKFRKLSPLNNIFKDFILEEYENKIAV